VLNYITLLLNAIALPCEVEMGRCTIGGCNSKDIEMDTTTSGLAAVTTSSNNNNKIDTDR
jgi:hypothetical protein